MNHQTTKTLGHPSALVNAGASNSNLRDGRRLASPIEGDQKPLGIGAVAAACRDFLEVYDSCATSDDLVGAFTELHRVLTPTRDDGDR